MSDDPRQRIAHFRRKFAQLPRHRLVEEYVRYERAKDGTLPNTLPEEYVNAAMAAIKDILRTEHRMTRKSMESWFSSFRALKSRPFIT